MKKIRIFLKSIIPPIINNYIKKLGLGIVRFEGDYKSWIDASERCEGYDSEEIATKALNASLLVKSGDFAAERDTVLFSEIQYSWPVTAALLLSAAKNGGMLSVIDIGGAFGSSYFQNIKFLSPLESVSWSIIEQETFVSLAERRAFKIKNVNFYDNLDTCLLETRPKIALLSSVLQYIPEPYHMLEILAKGNVDMIVIDRTPFSVNNRKKLKVQNVSKSIYKGSYPCWFFDARELEELMNRLGYLLLEKFESVDNLSHEAVWQGIIFTRVAK
ncbi:methyltransferase, TIGR04325 family [Betaproteobacteria bacterium LSUCC0117]|nr:methyltransferase, TIGR04325 family [Betaproteobacteria bacterium LSUCC0117]